MKANHASAFSQREGLSIYMYILLYQRSFTLPSSRFFLRATLIGLSLFALIYGLHVTVTREIFPSWDDTTVTLSCVTLALLFTVYRAALWQLPLFLFALSAVGIRFLADLITPARAFYHCLAFSAASWGLLAYLSPSSHTAWRKTYYLLGGFLITLPALVAWSYYFLTGSFPQSETLLAIMQTNAGEARGYLATHISLPLLLFPPLYLTALYLISQKSSQGATFTCPPLFARLALLAVVPAGPSSFPRIILSPPPGSVCRTTGKLMQTLQRNPNNAPIASRILRQLPLPASTSLPSANRRIVST